MTEDLAATDVAYRFGPRIEGGQTRFRLWAPGAAKAKLVVQGQTAVAMSKGSDGFFEAKADSGPGTRYKFRIGDLEFPDLASRQQHGDTTGWSVVREQLAPPPAFSRPWHEMVVCEVHVGTATPEGTFAALRERLEHFRDAGYTCLEIMPVNECPGSRNWGYDGTLVFAPESAYGTPEELRDLVARAHELGLTMILDVVYNHFGSVDNYAPRYVPEWFDEKIETPWGPGIDFNQEIVRQFYYENAIMWLVEYGFDGLRFDAVHEIKSDAKDQFHGELAATARAVKPGAKLILENMNNSTQWLERNDQNEPMTYWAQWNEDMHHVLAYIVTGEGNKTGYDEHGKDPVADLEKALADGFVHDHDEGPDSDGRMRGGPASQLPPDSFITYVENHDQIGNRADGKRLSSRLEPNRLDFVHFVKFIAPQIPLCFMGDEASLASSFPFFVDMSDEEGEKANQRRYKEMSEMFMEPVEDGDLPHPNDPLTFEMAKLPWDAFGEDQHLASLRRFRELASFRREKVWPLSATPCTDATSARHGQGLIINWMFQAGTLTLALNPTAAPLDMPCLIQGAPVSTGDFHQHGEVLRLGTWSAIAWRN
jgi:malto-oligosyltrehalose trehalohydrolase